MKEFDKIMQEAREIAKRVSDYETFDNNREELIDLYERALDASAKDEGYESFQEMCSTKIVEEFGRWPTPEVTIHDIEHHIATMGKFPILKPVLEVGKNE